MGVPSAAGVEASGRSPYRRDKANAVDQGTITGVGPGKPFVFYGTLNLFVWAEFTTTLTTTDGSLTASVASAGVAPAAIANGISINSILVPPGTTATISTTTLTLKLPIRTLWGKIKKAFARITDLYDTTWLNGATISGPGFAGTETVTGITTPAVQPNAMGQGKVAGVVATSAAPSSDLPDSVKPAPYEFALAAGAIAAGTDAAATFTGAAIGMTGTIQVERSFDGGKTWIVCNVGGSGMLAQFSTTTPISVSFGEPERGILYRLNVTALTTATGVALKYRISTTGQTATTVSIQTL